MIFDSLFAQDKTLLLKNLPILLSQVIFDRLISAVQDRTIKGEDEDGSLLVKIMNEVGFKSFSNPKMFVQGVEISQLERQEYEKNMIELWLYLRTLETLGLYSQGCIPTRQSKFWSQSGLKTIVHSTYFCSENWIYLVRLAPTMCSNEFITWLCTLNMAWFDRLQLNSKLASQ